MFQGKVFNIHETVIGKINMVKTDDKGISCLMETLNHDNILIRCGSLTYPVFDTKVWLNTDNIKLKIGDIISIMPNGSLRILHDALSNENILFLSDHCNYNCIMCPQPTPDFPQKYFEQANTIVRLLDKNTKVIGITGGEPLLDFDNFLNLLQTINDCLPDVHLQILTNGSLLADKKNVENLFKIQKKGMTFCIPIYSANPKTHDLIVGKDGSFWATVKALHNLALHDADLEIRTVIIRQNYNELENIAHFISMNLPFINHFAIMGAEYIGNANNNFSDTYINPAEYSYQIENSIKTLKRSNILFSIYNHPLCLLPESAKAYSTKSISSWKVRFIEKCSSCLEKSDCGGIFFANVKAYKNIIN